MKAKGIESLNTIGIWIVIVLTSFYYHICQGFPDVITWDVYGYYLYLPALLKFGDTSQYLFALDHLSTYHMSSELYQLMEWKGTNAPIYTIGMAIIYLPFYLIADICAHLVPGLPADGMSLIYQWAIIIASWSYAFLGILFTYKVLSILKFDHWIITLTLAVIFLGTNYFHYAAFENGMPHIYLYALYSILIYLVVLWHKEAKISYAVYGGIVIALMCLIRPSEVIAIIIPLGYGVYNGLSSLVKVNRIITYRNQIFLMIFAGLLMVSPQLIFWKINLDQWIFNGYAGHHFDFMSPHIMEGLFSYRKGWLLYSPLCILSIIGIPLLWKRDKRFFIPVASFFVLNIYIVLSWHIWWYASSFGMRALIQSYAILAIPMAVTMERIGTKSLLKYTGMIIIIVLILLNQIQDWQYRNKILLQDEMNATFYWKSFLKLDLDKQLRQYIDNDEKYGGNKEPLLIAGYRFQGDEGLMGGDTILPDNYSYTHRLPLEDNLTGSEDWVKVEAHLKMTNDNFDSHKQARLVTAIKSKDANLKWTGIRFQSIIDKGIWHTISYDFKIKSFEKPEEYLEVTIWNNSPDTVLLRSLNIYKYE